MEQLICVFNIDYRDTRYVYEKRRSSSIRLFWKCNYNSPISETEKYVIPDNCHTERRHQIWKLINTLEFNSLFDSRYVLIEPAPISRRALPLALKAITKPITTHTWKIFKRVSSPFSLFISNNCISLSDQNVRTIWILTKRTFYQYLFAQIVSIFNYRKI